MSSEPSDKEEAVYQIIFKMVLWDENKDDIFTKLAANGYDGAVAERLYQRARAGRISLIRRGSVRTAGKGILWLALGSGLFALFWFKLGGITHRLLWLVAVAVLYGFWKLTEGVAGFIMAGQKTGSLADDE